ncbi:hypothetical protein CBR_g625 [Chara braunii]|uniref:DUF659 domain-containing protein n=1 Tax=Chara braunii TaxID=69332 RepID=A0A388KBR7_CHABU|nr:hypothetical protein CBR_g625 [Chara braunii]|eukprot:GBG67490.1 hypothetical protein CBR_g625 [Chara braunii]
MECKLCGQGFQGSLTKAAHHFTMKNNCAKVFEQMAKIWNKTKYGFDPSHQRKIVDFLKSRGLRDNRCGSGREPAGEEEFEDSEDERRAVEGGEDDGESDSQDMEVRRETERSRGKMRREKPVVEDSTPDEDDDDDDDDQGADLGASLDGGLMADGRRGQEGAAKAMKAAAGSKKRKRKAKMTATEARSAPSQPKKSRWWYVSGIPFEAARRPEYHTMRKKLLECPPYAHPALPTHRVTSCDGIPQQQRVVADMEAAIRRDIEATGATILTDGRKSITSDQIVNFLAAGPTGAYLFGTVQRDNAVQETAEAVVERWKDVFDKFGVDKVNAICTDSASAYVAASTLLTKEEPRYSHITWLPCAVHVCNLLLSDIAKDGRDGSLGKREDTIMRARAVVRFIREHGAALSPYRWFYAAHPSSASAATGCSSSAPPPSQRRGRELVYPAQTRFATHYLMLERLLDRRRALEALMMSDDWLQTAWRRSIFLQARWVQRGRKDCLSKAPPSIATGLMAIELESVYDLEPDPMAQDAMEAKPWSDTDDLAVESEPGGSDDDDGDTPLIQISRPRTRASTAAAAPSPAARPPSSAPDVSLRGTADRVKSTTLHPSTDHGGDADDREGYEGSSEDEVDPCYSPTRGHGDDDDDEGGDGGQPVGGLRKSERQHGDRCSGAGRGGSGPGVGGAQHTSGAGCGGRGQVRRESASSTRTVHWVDKGRLAEAAVVAPSPTEVAPSPAEFAAASAEGAGRFAGVGGEGVQVGRPSAQLGVSFGDNIFDVPLGFPPTPAGEHVGADADTAATPVSRIVRGIPSCSAGNISSSMLQEAPEGTPGWSGQHEHATGDDGECRHVHKRATESEQDRIDREERRTAQGLASRCEMTQSIALRARVARMLETGVAAGDEEAE